MSKVELIKQEIASLTEAEWDELEAWLLNRPLEDDDWDRQMRADAEAGKLDRFLDEARKEIEQGRVRELP